MKQNQNQKQNKEENNGKKFLTKRQMFVEINGSFSSIETQNKLHVLRVAYNLK